MKIFQLLMMQPPFVSEDNNKVTNTQHDSNRSMRQRHSLSDILSNPRKGRCIYRLDYKKQGKSGKTASNGSISSNNFGSVGAFQTTENMLVEVDILKE